MQISRDESTERELRNVVGDQIQGSVNRFAIATDPDARGFKTSKVALASPEAAKCDMEEGKVAIIKVSTRSPIAICGAIVASNIQGTGEKKRWNIGQGPPFLR
jgi:hypothetical protein